MVCASGRPARNLPCLKWARNPRLCLEGPDWNRRKRLFPEEVKGFLSCCLPHTPARRGAAELKPSNAYKETQQGTQWFRTSDLPVQGACSVEYLHIGDLVENTFAGIQCFILLPCQSGPLECLSLWSFLGKLGISVGVSVPEKLAIRSLDVFINAMPIPAFFLSWLQGCYIMGHAHMLLTQEWIRSKYIRNNEEESFIFRNPAFAGTLCSSWGHGQEEEKW